MGVNLYNGERYLDPTAYEALTSIELRRKHNPMAFKGSPFADDRKSNIDWAKRYTRSEVLKDKVPTIPGGTNS